MCHPNKTYRNTEYRTGAIRSGRSRNDECEPVFLDRRPSGWYLPEPTVTQGCASRPGFDTVRPAWLSRPDFTPVDTSQPLLARADDAYIDVTRPELWMDEDGEFSSSAPRRVATPSLVAGVMRTCGRLVTRLIARPGGMLHRSRGR
jgi:hypothetical protein